MRKLAMFTTTVCVLFFESKKVLDSGFHVLDFVIRVLNFEFFFSGTWILDLIVQGIPESLSCVSDSKAQYSGCYKQNSPIPESRFPCIGDSLPL